MSDAGIADKVWSVTPETKKTKLQLKTHWVSYFLLRSRFDCRGRSELFLVRLSDDPPSPSGSKGREVVATLPPGNTVPDVLATLEDTAALLDVEGTAVLGLGPPIAAALLSISSRSLCSSSARRAFCSAITWVCSSSFCSWSCSCFCCSSCLTRISCISLRSTVIDAPFTFTCCCTLVISERDGVFLASRDMVVREVDGPATEGKRTEGQRSIGFCWCKKMQNRRCSARDKQKYNRTRHFILADVEHEKWSLFGRSVHSVHEGDTNDCKVCL